MVFVSFGFRFRVEVEALNMVEPMGAYVKHRFVPVYKQIHKEGNGTKSVKYKLVYAPAISGQSICNGYTKALAQLEKLKNPTKPRLCDECANYELREGFTKRSTDNVNHDQRVCECLIEDLTGFMQAAEGAPDKRTSPVSFSYMVPDVESATTRIEPQFHVRFSFGGEHAPFTIESGTAIYMLGVTIDVDKIGRLKDGSYVNDVDDRIEMTFKALEVLIEGLNFGAKKSRYLPILDVIGAIATVADPLPYVVSPPRVSKSDNYIIKTIIRAKDYVDGLEDFGQRMHIVYMDKEGIIDKADLEKLLASKQVKQSSQGAVINVANVDTVTQLIEDVISVVKGFLQNKNRQLKSCEDVRKSPKGS
uniref:DevR family CRISPR-associated autoregulator n=1 Tax=Ignisphaera aggregans TaxID=334771 RepID=A0A7J2TAQ3_9CREN